MLSEPVITRCGPTIEDIRIISKDEEKIQAEKQAEKRRPTSAYLEPSRGSRLASALQNVQMLKTFSP